MKWFWQTLWRYRWFVLGCVAVAINGWGVWHWAQAGRGAVTCRVVSPLDGLVTGRVEVVWEFSEAMVAADALERYPEVAPVTFTPAVAGTCRWETPRRLVFRPRDDWRRCSEFAAALAPRLTSLAGRPVSEGRTGRFHTPPLALADLRQIEYRADGIARVQLTFDDGVDLDLLAGRVTFTNGQGVAFRHEHEAAAPDSAVHIFQLPVLPADDVLGVTLSAGLQGVSGPLGLTNEVRRSVRLAADLDLIEVEPVVSGPPIPASSSRSTSRSTAIRWPPMSR